MSIPLAKTNHIQRKKLDIAYAAVSTAQTLDIYWPEAGSGPFPVIVAVHGGAFRGGDKRDTQVSAMLEGVRHGYAVVSINYRMSGEAIFPALVHDVKSAIRWIRANSAENLLNSDQIAIWGNSAGGYLALMAGVSGGITDLEDLSLGNGQYSSSVQAVVDWFGPTDFLAMDPQLAELGLGPTPGDEHNGANSPESLILGGKITEIPKVVQIANPERHVRTGLPPFLIQHGLKDPIVPCLQSVRMVEKLRSLTGNKVTLDLLEDAGHGGPQFESAENLDRVFAFLDTHLKRQILLS